MTFIRTSLSILVVLCVLMLLCACAGENQPATSPSVSKDVIPVTSTASTTPPTEPDIFDPWNPETYSIDDVILIEEIDDGERETTTWLVYFTNNGTNLYAYVSVPNKVLTEKVPYSCVVYNRDGNPRLGSLTPNIVAGYAITCNSVAVAVEIRGAFPNTGKFENGDAEASDVRKLIDICENFAFIDLDRLYMIGKSNGSVRTYMVIRNDERIKKAVILSGVADMFISWEYREDMHDLLIDWTGGTPTSKPDEYKKRSAVYWADELKCPVLIIHSKLDPRASYEDAEKLVAALEAAGKEYKFVSYDDDHHGGRAEDIPIIEDWCDFGPKVS